MASALIGAIRTIPSWILWAVLLGYVSAQNHTSDFYHLLNLTRAANHEYYAMISIGTPPQPMQFNIDLARADSFVNLACGYGHNTTTMNGTSYFCCTPGVGISLGCLNNNISTSFEYNHTTYGEYVNTTYISETIGLGDNGTSNPNVTDLPLLLIDYVGNASLGLGLKATEEEVELYRYGYPYPSYDSFLYLLPKQGLTKSASLSLYSGGMLPWETPQLLFGAIDRSKYVEGTIGRVPLVPTPQQYETPANTEPRLPDAYNILLHGMSVTNSTTPEHNTTTRLIESSMVVRWAGSGATFVSATLMNSILEYFGGWTTGVNAILPCSVGNTYSFAMNFSGIVINVPLSSLLTPTDSFYQSYTDGSFSGGVSIPGSCILSWTYVPYTAEETSITIGPDFWKHAYFAMDVDNNEMAIGQLRENASSVPPDIQLIDRAGIPNVPEAPLYSYTSQTAFISNLMTSARHPWTTLGSSATALYFKQSIVGASPSTNGHMSTASVPSADLGVFTTSGISEKNNAVRTSALSPHSIIGWILSILMTLT